MRSNYANEEFAPNAMTCATYRNVPPFASTSNPSSGSAEHLPLPPLASLKPSFAILPTCVVGCSQIEGVARGRHKYQRLEWNSATAPTSDDDVHRERRKWKSGNTRKLLPTDECARGLLSDYRWGTSAVAFGARAPPPDCTYPKDGTAEEQRQQRNDQHAHENLQAQLGGRLAVRPRQQ